MKNFFYRTIREYIFNMLFHHFSKISLRISYKKIYIYFQHNHNTTTNIRKFTLIYCFQLLYKSLSSFTNGPNNVYNGQRIQFRIMFYFRKENIIFV